MVRPLEELRCLSCRSSLLREKKVTFRNIKGSPTKVWCTPSTCNSNTERRTYLKKNFGSGRGSRWGRSRTWRSCFPTKILKIHLQVELFTQNIYWTLKEDLRLPKGQENLHITRYNKRKKKKRRNWDRACLSGRKLWRGIVPAPREVSHAEISLDEGGSLEPRRREKTVCRMQNGE